MRLRLNLYAMAVMDRILKEREIVVDISWRGGCVKTKTVR